MDNNQRETICQICNKELPKYRCPKCRIQYCSVPCFKSHRETGCVSVTTDERNEQKDQMYMLTHRNQQKEEGELSDDEENTEDKVPLEKLQKLGNSQKLLQMLENPHLRSMMIGLVESHDPSHQIEAAMQEPIFLELADECLDIIKDENALPKG